MLSIVSVNWVCGLDDPHSRARIGKGKSGRLEFAFLGLARWKGI